MFVVLAGVSLHKEPGTILQVIFTISHGETPKERVFSLNKNLLPENNEELTILSLPLPLPLSPSLSLSLSLTLSLSLSLSLSLYLSLYLSISLSLKHFTVKKWAKAHRRPLTLQLVTEFLVWAVMSVFVVVVVFFAISTYQRQSLHCFLRALMLFL